MVWQLSFPTGTVHNVSTSILLPGSSDRLLFYDGLQQDTTRLFGVVVGSGTRDYRQLFSTSSNITAVFVSDTLPKPPGTEIRIVSRAIAPPLHCSGMNTTGYFGNTFMEPITPGVSYALNLRCGWIFIGNATGFVTIGITRMNIMPGHALKLFDGYDTSAPLLAAVSGALTPSVSSTGPVMYVLFESGNTSTGDTYPYVGGFQFKASYTVGPRRCQPTTALTLMSGDQISIYGNAVPGESPGYLPGQTCTWHLSVPYGVFFQALPQPVTLQLTAGDDSLAFYAGANAMAPLLGRYTGESTFDASSLPLPVVGGELFIAFNTSASNRSPGTGFYFTLQAASHFIVTQRTEYIVAPIGACYGCINIPTSPGNGRSYIGIGNVTYAINAPSGYSASISITTCSLAPGDRLIITDSSPSGPTVVATLSGVNCTYAYSSIHANLNVTLIGTHNISLGALGFQADVFGYIPQSQCAGTQSFYDLTGNFSAPHGTPSMPRRTAYTTNSVCRWAISTPCGNVGATIASFDLGPGVVLLFNSSVGILGNLTGTGTEAIVLSPVADLTVILDTTGAPPGNHHYYGFDATWNYYDVDTSYLLREADNFPVIDQTCICSQEQYMSSTYPSTYFGNPVSPYHGSYQTRLVGPTRFLSNQYFDQAPMAVGCYFNTFAFARGTHSYRVIFGDSAYGGASSYLSQYPTPRGEYVIYDGPDFDSNIIAASDYEGSKVGVSGIVTIVYTSPAVSTEKNGFGVLIYPQSWQNRALERGSMVVYNGVKNISVTGPGVYYEMRWTDGRSLPTYVPNQQIQYTIRTYPGGRLGLRCNGQSTKLNLKAYDGDSSSAPLIHPGCADGSVSSLTTGSVVYVTMSAPPDQRIVPVAWLQAITTQPTFYCPPTTEIWAPPVAALPYGSSTQAVAGALDDWYPRGLQCAFVIRAPAGSVVSLAFTGGVDATSTLTVHDGADRNAPIIEPTYPTSVYYSTGPVAFVYFDAGNAVYRTAFSGFSFIPVAIDVSPAAYPQGTASIFVYQAIVSSVNYPTSGTFIAGRYPVRSNYTVELAAELGSYLQFSISMRTEPDADYLSIYERGAPVWRGSGGAPVPVIKTICNTATLTFTSNDVTSAYDQGFRIVISAVPYVATIPAVCRPKLSTQICPAICGNDSMITTYGVCSVITASVTYTGANLNVVWPNLEAMYGSFQPVNLVARVFNATRARYLKLLPYAPIVDVSVLRELGTLAWEGNTNLTSASFPTIRSAAVLSIKSSPFCTVIDLSGLIYGGALMLQSLPQLTSVALPSHPWQVATLCIGSTPQLANLDMSWLTRALSHGGVSLTGLTARTIDLSRLVSTPSISMISLTAKEILIPSIYTLPEMLRLDTLLSLTTLCVSNLAATQNVILNIMTIPELSFPSLRIVSSSIQVSASPALTSLQLPNLYEAISITLSDTGISAFNVPSLLQLGSLTLTDNNRLKTLSVCALGNVNIVSISGSGLLSCADSTATLGEVAATYLVVDCDPVSGGNFGCTYDENIYVPVSCNSTTCIQATIATVITQRGTTVIVPPGTYTGCSRTPLDTLGKAFRLVGAGANSTVIDCQGSGRGLGIASGEDSDTIIEDIRFINGRGDTGGLVVISGGATPILRRVTVRNGHASVAGGGMAILSGAAPLLIDCHVNDSTAPTGGGIYVSAASVTMVGCVLAGSTATESGLAVTTPLTMPVIEMTQFLGNEAARGGGIFADDTILGTNLTVVGNSASFFGGGLALMPSQPLGVPFNLTDITISGNQAGLGGGGLYSFSGDLHLARAMMAHNSAPIGGGIYVTCSLNYRFLESVAGACAVRAEIVGSSLVGNSASQNGGGAAFVNVMASLNAVNISNNVAVMGGGAYASATMFSLASSMVISNVATDFGAGLSCEPFTGSCQVTSTRFAGNSGPLAGAGVFLCVGTCAVTNTTTSATVPFAASAYLLPNLRSGGGNVYADNLVQRGGYGVDVATDPAIMTWVTPPSPEIISGRDVTADGVTPITIAVTDAYGNPITAAAEVQTISLCVMYSNGASAASEVVISGAGTVILSSGTVSFPGVSFLASTLADLSSPYLISANLAGVPSVILTAPLRLLPCQPGQGTSGSGPVSCSDCVAGTFGTGDGDYTCVACPLGTYATSARSSVCTPCAAQTYAPVAGAGACIDCPAGYSAPAGASVCTQDATAAVNQLVTVGTPVGASVAVLLILAVIAAFFVWRYARKRTLKQYYLDTDSTIRTGAVKTPLQRDVEALIIHSSTTRIGGGVYADVYKARYKGKWVALKVLKTEMIGNQLALDEFQRETVAMNRLNGRMHPGVVHLRFFLQKKPMCIGMEFCPNGSVKGALARGSLSAEDKIRVLAEAASALTVLHDLNIAHLDIKTDNLLLDAENHVKMADFGISQTLIGTDDDSSAPLAAIPAEYVDPEAAEVNAENPLFGSTDGGLSALGSTTLGSLTADQPLPAADMMGSMVGADAQTVVRLGAPPVPRSSAAPNAMRDSQLPPAAPRQGESMIHQPGHTHHSIVIPNSDRQSLILPGGERDSMALQTLGPGFDPSAFLAGGGVPSASARTSIALSDVGSVRARRLSTVARAAEAYTPQYVDPMRIEHDLVDLEFLKGADIFSFSLVMWAVMSEEEPYAGVNVKDLLDELRANVTKRPPPVLRPISQALDALIQRSWAHDRSARPSAQQLHKELAAIMQGEYNQQLAPGYGLDSLQA